jgi:hypothetical protein
LSAEGHAILRQKIKTGGCRCSSYYQHRAAGFAPLQLSFQLAKQSPNRLGRLSPTLDAGELFFNSATSPVENSIPNYLPNVRALLRAEKLVPGDSKLQKIPGKF